jgi:predicted RNA-binding Zn ribbon-like protein
MLVKQAPAFVGGALCLDFANTVARRLGTDTGDALSSGADLVTWAAAAGLPLATSHRVEAALPDLRSLRAAVHGVFSALAEDEEPRSDLVTQIASAYADALSRARWRRAGAQLVTEWPAPRQAQELAGPVSASAMELLRHGPLGRVGRCPGCGYLFIDGSRNGRRRWCSMARCGNRQKVAAHYARTRAAVTCLGGV